jgi:hypothetical protein
MAKSSFTITQILCLFWFAETIRKHTATGGGPENPRRAVDGFYFHLTKPGDKGQFDFADGPQTLSSDDGMCLYLTNYSD